MVTVAVRDAAPEGQRSMNANLQQLVQLTPMDADIIRCMRQGIGNDQIAYRVGLTPSELRERYVHLSRQLRSAAARIGEVASE